MMGPVTTIQMPKKKSLNPTRNRSSVPNRRGSAFQTEEEALRVLALYEVVQRWVTGERAKQTEEDIERDIFEHVRRLMHLSGLKKLPGRKHPDTNLYLWKKACAHTSRAVTYVMYRCPMRHRCKCFCCLWRVTGRDCVELQRSGLQ
jgi:hypothetical protein